MGTLPGDDRSLRSSCIYYVLVLCSGTLLTGGLNTLQKKTHPRHFGPNEFFFRHTYDTSMTIIVTKPGIIIDVVGSYFYDKNHHRKWAFCPGRAGDAAA